MSSYLLNPTSDGVSDSVAPIGGLHAPLDIKEGVISNPMLAVIFIAHIKKIEENFEY